MQENNAIHSSSPAAQASDLPQDIIESSDPVEHTMGKLERGEPLPNIAGAQMAEPKLTRDEVIAALIVHGDEWKIFWIDFPDHLESELTNLEEQWEIEPVGEDLEKAIVAKAFRRYCESDTREVDFNETLGEVIRELTFCKGLL
jgi:hypothetical protein